MGQKLGKHFIKVLGLLLAAPLLLWSVASTHADPGSIRVISFDAASEFPEGMRFKIEAESDNEITSIAVRFRTGRQTRDTYEYVDFESSPVVDSELFWRTNSIGRYIPPGTIISYNFEIEDSEGARLDTEPEEFIYYDARFEWEEVSEGPVAVAYHGPVRTRAETIRDAITQTLAHMGPLLGADTEEPIRVTMYNNIKEMLGALPPGSATIRRELITEGQAFSNVGTLLVLGGSRLSKGTASHEVVHILTHRAGNSVYGGVPAWLNEGLAEYGNIDPGFSYDIALEFAVATHRLLPITFTQILPGVPEDVIIFYGEARSIVKYMIDRFGAEKMKELMAAMKSGKNQDDAIQEVYGMSHLELENKWRAAALAYIPYKPPEPGTARPTPLPRPAVLPYSLTPQPQSATVGATASTPTPEPTPVDTPTPEPTPTATAVVAARGEPEPTPTAALQEKEAEGGGGTCSRPRAGGPGVVDMSAVALLVGLVGLGVRRRIRW